MLGIGWQKSVPCCKNSDCFGEIRPEKDTPSTRWRARTLTSLVLRTVTTTTRFVLFFLFGIVACVNEESKVYSIKKTQQFINKNKEEELVCHVVFHFQGFLQNSAGTSHGLLDGNQDIVPEIGLAATSRHAQE